MSTPPRGSTLVAITTRATRPPRRRDCILQRGRHLVRLPPEEPVDHDDDKTHPLPTSARAEPIVSALPRPVPPLSGAHTGCPLGAQTPGNRREFPACR